MKKILFIGLCFLISSVTLANSKIEEGVYSNGEPGCEVSISIYDFFNPGQTRLVSEFEENIVTPYGAFLTQKIENAGYTFNESKVVYVGNETGNTNFHIATLNFDTEGLLKGFRLVKANKYGFEISTPHICENLELHSK